VTVRSLQIRRRPTAIAANGHPASQPTQSQPRGQSGGETRLPGPSAFRPLFPQPHQSHAEKRVFAVPRGIHIVGMVRDVDALWVEGEILTPFVAARELVVAQGGACKGEIEVDEADIAGTMDGTILVRHRLIVRATAKIFGVARCSMLHVEDGARLNSFIEMTS
jgi:cytoskeletal protein CcmA (bactofilin family)